MNDPTKSPIYKLAESYKRSPVIRSLVQLILGNIGSAFDVGLTTFIENIREDRARTFFDELGKRDFPLTEDEIKSEDFLHAYFATCRAALNTRRREKIRLFARLLHNYASKSTAVEEFEEHLTILDDLSYRELQVLLILEHYEEANPQRNFKNVHTRAELFWEDFQSECSTKLAIPTNELNGVLTRLTRTGLYETIAFTSMGNRGRLTRNFYRFIEHLKAAKNE